MIELRFRAKWAPTEWIYGDSLEKHPWDTHVAFRISDKSVSRSIPKNLAHTLGMWIGIYDKNDKEIYDGDIVKYSDQYYEVEIGTTGPMIRDSVGGYVLNIGMYGSYDNGCSTNPFVIGNLCEVVGNKYDNTDWREWK